MVDIIVANALFASTYTISKWLLQYMQPLYLLAFRMLCAGILLFLYQFCVAREGLRFSSYRLFGYMLQIAFFNTYLSYALEFWALQYISSIKVTFLYNLAPLVTPFYSYIFFHERMTPKKWLGLTIGFLGIIPALLQSNNQEEALGMIGFISLPELAVIIGVFAYCYGWIYMRKLVRDYKAQPIAINAWIMTIGGLFTLVNALMVEQVQPIANPMQFASGFLGLVILGNLISSTLYAYLFKFYTVTFVSFTTLTIPLFAAVYGYFFLGETLHLTLVLSMMIVSIGLYIFYQEELRQGYVVPRQKKKEIL